MSEHAPKGGALFAPDFYLQSKRAWRATPHWNLVDRSSFANHVLSKLRAEVNADLNSESQGFQWVEPSLNGFEGQVAEIRKGFTNRGLAKAVPIVHAEVREMPNITRLLGVLARLTQLPSSLIPYGFWSFEPGSEQGLIGATPEVLFSNRSGRDSGRPNRIETMALAGTRAKTAGGGDATVLFHDSKERHEHQLVIDDIRDVLETRGRVEIGEIGPVGGALTPLATS